MEDLTVGNGYPTYDPDQLYLQYDDDEPDAPLTLLQELERDKQTVRHWLWMMPLQSATELAATTGLGKDRIYRVLRGCVTNGVSRVAGV